METESPHSFYWSLSSAGLEQQPSKLWVNGSNPLVITIFEESYMSNRYNHWFWNSRLVDHVAGLVVKLDSYIWRKQYNNH